MHDSCSCRDIKPENFLTGLSSGPNFNMIYLVDFGLATSYLDSRGDHYQFSDAKVMTGTARQDKTIL
jgi:serine/threonine protein kinase